MNISFENKIVLVTGAGRGIGRAIVRAFVNGKAAKVYALSKTKSLLESLAAEVPAGTGVVIPVVVDLSDWNATKMVLEKIEPVDILVNNAGVSISELLVDVRPESFDEQINVNVKAVINVSQTIAKKMIERKSGGCIINLSSQASQMGFKTYSVYCATKAALDSLTRVMAVELGEHKIRVVSVNPTVVFTEMGRQAWGDENKSKLLLDRIPLHRFAEVEDVVNTVLFLASEKAAMINASAIPIEGGILAT